jgi:hypothetical protein
MTTTSFIFPATVNQVSIPNEITGWNSIPWHNLDLVVSTDSYASTTEGLYTISGLWMEKFLTNTNQIWLTNFHIPNTGRTIAGIEFQLNVKRLARIEDLIVQLTYDGDLIGDNRASTINPVQSNMYTGDFDAPPVPLADYNIYGSPTDLWGATITNAMLSDPSFGVVVSLKSNQIYPHRDLALVNQVALRITYA